MLRTVFLAVVPALIAAQSPSFSPTWTPTSAPSFSPTFSPTSAPTNFDSVTTNFPTKAEMYTFPSASELVGNVFVKDTGSEVTLIGRDLIIAGCESNCTITFGSGYSCNEEEGPNSPLGSSGMTLTDAQSVDLEEQFSLTFSVDIITLYGRAIVIMDQNETIKACGKLIPKDQIFAQIGGNPDEPTRYLGTIKPIVKPIAADENATINETMANMVEGEVSGYFNTNELTYELELISEMSGSRLLEEDNETDVSAPSLAPSFAPTFAPTSAPTIWSLDGTIDLRATCEDSAEVFVNSSSSFELVTQASGLIMTSDAQLENIVYAVVSVNETAISCGAVFKSGSVTGFITITSETLDTEEGLQRRLMSNSSNSSETVFLMGSLENLQGQSTILVYPSGSQCEDNTESPLATVEASSNINQQLNGTAEEYKDAVMCVKTGDVLVSQAVANSETFEQSTSSPTLSPTSKGDRPPSPSPSTDNDGNDNGLSAGAIAGIVIGVLFLLALCGLGARKISGSGEDSFKQKDYDNVNLEEANGNGKPQTSFAGSDQVNLN